MIFRKATLPDVDAICGLVNHYAEQGLVLPRSRHSIFESLRDFTVAEEDGKIVGVGALVFAWDGLAEVRANAVSPEFLRKGIGGGIVRELITEAARYGIKKLFVLTYCPEFFITHGFREVPKEQLPHKVWRDCINCSKFPNCDETAMILDL